MVGLVGSTLGLGRRLGIALGLRGRCSAVRARPRRRAWSSRRAPCSGPTPSASCVTLVAAYLPARRAAGCPPSPRCATTSRSPSGRCAGAPSSASSWRSVGVRPWSAAVRHGGRRRSLVGLGVLVLDPRRRVALSPVLAGPSCAASARCCPRLFGTTGRLARENALRNPRRTAATASALMVGLALVTAFSVIGASTNARIDKLIDGRSAPTSSSPRAVRLPFAAEVADAGRRASTASVARSAPFARRRRRSTAARRS